MWQYPEVGAAMRRRAESLAMKTRVAELTRTLFQESFMTNQISGGAIS
jgi:hypothetical protein